MKKIFTIFILSIGKYAHLSRFCLIVMVGVLLAFSPLIIAPPGLNSPEAIGPYLNGVFSDKVPGAGVEWEIENAFPNLTFVDPVQFVKFPDRDKFLVAGKKGKLWMVDNDPATTTKQVMLDIENQVFTAGDAGLLGAIFHPEFGQAGSPNRGYIYVFYRYFPPNLSRSGVLAYIRLSRFTLVDGSNTINPNTEYVMIQQYDRHDWHNGGGMFFGSDEFLYLTVGDEGGANDQFNTTQEIDKWLFGGILRIDVDRDPTRSHPIRRQPQNAATPPSGWPGSYSQGYYIPNDNPWQDPNGGILEEFYALGLRSPHRMTYDAPTGDIWIGDVGQGSREEVSVAGKGDNMQWPYREGSVSGPKAKPVNLIGTDRPPIHDYGRGIGNCVIGGFVYRGSKFPELFGKYIFGDHGTRNVWTLSPNAQRTDATKDFIINIPAEGVGGKSGISGFETDDEGNVYILKLFGTNLDGGKIYKLKSTNVSPEPPQLLSQTGAFANLTNLTPAQGVMPYKVNAPLWSDRAEKERWVALPNDGTFNSSSEQVYFRADSEWDFPEGTVFIKHFELPVDESNPAITRKVETRFFVLGKDGAAYGVTYKWNDAGTDAELLMTGDSKPFTITREDGSTYQQTWDFPSRQECITCHNENAGSVLGVKTHQLNGDLTYPSTGITANQLETWNHLGIFHTDIGDPLSYLQAKHISDPNASLEIRVRSYLDANCAMCHRPGGVNGAFDARFPTPLDFQNIINSNNISNASTPGGKIVVPGNPQQSEMWIRDVSLNGNSMPPLAKNLVDDTYIAVLTDWINGLDPTNNECNQQIRDYNLLSIHGFDSEEPLYGRFATNVIDGDVNTFWHTEWVNSAPPYPHEIQIDLGEDVQVVGLRYLPRQDASFNGTISDYEIYISQDGTNWGLPLTSGSFDGTKNWQEVFFASVNARYVMLRGLNEVNGNPWASAAEIEVVELDCISDPNEPPVAAITANPISGTAPLEVSFDGSSSTDPENEVLSYEWDFGTGFSSIAQSPTHTYNNPGEYTVRLIVTDIRGFKDTAFVTIDVANPADLTPPSIPANLVTSNISFDNFTLSWDASTDDQSGVAGYYVYQDGIADPIDTVPNTTVVIEGLASETTYFFAVSAFDAEGNQSSQSTAIAVTTTSTPCMNPLEVSTDISDITVCDSTGSVLFNITGGFGNADIIVTEDITGNDVSDNLDQLPAGGYSYLVLDGTCEATGTFEIDPAPIPAVIEVSAAQCAIDLLTYSVDLTVNDGDIVSSDSGQILDNGAGEFQIDNIPTDQGLMITVTHPTSACDTSFTIPAPDCNCPVLAAPVSGGDVEYCVGDAIPELSVSVDAGLSANWYAGETGGDPLNESPSTSYTPEAAGTYYIEAIDPATGCLSDTRTAVTVTENALPVVNIVGEATCSEDFQTYSVTVDVSGGDDVSADLGTLVDNQDGTYTFSEIPAGTDITVTVANTTTTCQVQLPVTAPDCNCPVLAAPVSGGDVEYCVGDAIPELSVSVDTVLSANWYAGETGGDPLNESPSTSYTPEAAGTYYVEAIDPATGCLSDTRTAVTVTENVLPVVSQVGDAVCAEDNRTYSVTVSVTGGDDATADVGTKVDNQDGTYTFLDIPADTDINLTSNNNGTGCIGVLTINSPTCESISTDPISYWPFDNNALDAIGSNDGTLFGNAGFSTDNYAGGFSLSLDGTNSYVEVSPAASSGFLHDAFGTRTISGWMKPSGLSGIQTIFDEGGAGRGIALRLNGSILEAQVKNGSATTILNTPYPLDGQWHSFAVVFDQGEFSLYVDGEIRTSLQSAFTVVDSHGDDGCVGISEDTDAFEASGNAYSGLLDEIRVYDIALSAPEVAALGGNPGSGKLFQAITFPSIADRTTEDPLSFVVPGVSASSGLPVSVFNSSGPISSVEMIGNELQITLDGSVGTVSITLAQEGDDTYDPALEVTQSFIVTPPSQVGNDPIAYWPFDNNALDAIGNNDGTLFGNAGFSTDNYAGGFSLSLDGTNSYVEVSPTASSGFLHDAFTTRTVTGWVKPSSLSGIQTIFEEGGSSFGIAIRLNEEQLEAIVKINSFDLVILSTPYPSDGVWHSFGIVFDQGKFDLYLDGDLKQTGNSISILPEVPQHGDKANVGVSRNSDAFGDQDNFFSGSIDEVKVYDVALEDSEIQSNFGLEQVSVNSFSTTPSHEYTKPEPFQSNVQELMVESDKHLSIEDLSKLISYYPNPFDEMLYLEWSGYRTDVQVDVQIINAIGKSIYVQENIQNQSKLMIDTYNWPRGTYILRLNIQDKIYNLKIIK